MSERREKFTPGPWVADGTTVYADAFKSGRNVYGAVACLAIGEDDTAFQEIANAHLIAAAPDLYEALEGVLRVADRQTVEFDAARAALAKARGEQ